MSDEGPLASSLVDRVAEAILESDRGVSINSLTFAGTWQNLPASAKIEYRRRARAAIEAMRPITPEMRDAYDTEACDVQGNAASLVDTAYGAMIDAALSSSERK